MRRITSTLGTALLAIATLAFLALAIAPHVFGYRTSTVLSGSMTPHFRPGDVVVLTPEPVTKLRVGQVLSYHIPVDDHRIVTHRVVKVTERNGRVDVRTKGDANASVDPWTAQLSAVPGRDTVYVQRWSVPHLGTVITKLRAPIVQQLLVWGCLVGLLLAGTAVIWAGKALPHDADLDGRGTPAAG